MVMMAEKKKLSDFVTSYDLIKTFAVIFMLVDHIGFYFYPDDMLLRALGRWCVPIWFFLIGFAHSRDIGPKLWIGAAILLAGNYMAGIGMFPLNILVTMLVIRIALDDIMRHVLRNRHALMASSVILLFLIYPTAFAFEYGTQGVILAMFGWLCRHRKEITDGRKILDAFGTFALFSFVLLQTTQFGFSQPLFFVTAIGTVIVMAVLYFFRYVEYPSLSKGVLRPLAFVFKLTGRRTLEIYVLHLMLFKLIGVMTNPDRFGWFELHLMITPANVGVIG